jgi:hypothetical protein
MGDLSGSGGGSMKNKTCGECCFFDVETDMCFFDSDHLSEAYSDCEACAKFEPANPTVFHRIATSPEVLAPYFVTADFDEPFLPWFSTLTNESFETHEEAIAATVEKLKEVCDE